MLPQTMADHLLFLARIWTPGENQSHIPGVDECRQGSRNEGVYVKDNTHVKG